MPSINGIVPKNPNVALRKCHNVSQLERIESVIRWKSACKHNNPKDTGVGE
jgi:ribosomal protein S12